MPVGPKSKKASGRGGYFLRLQPEEQLARWGRNQHRQVTIEQLQAVGWDASVVHKRVKAGRLHPVFRGVYSLGGPPQTDRELWMAATLTYGPGTKLSHGATVDLYGWLRYPLGGLHVTTPTKRPSRHGITAHHTSRPTTNGHRRHRGDRAGTDGPRRGNQPPERQGVPARRPAIADRRHHPRPPPRPDGHAPRPPRRRAAQARARGGSEPDEERQRGRGPRGLPPWR